MFLSCGNTNAEIAEVVADPNAPMEVSQNVTMLFSDKGVAQLKLESPLVHRFLTTDPETKKEDMKLECPTGMKVTFFDSIGQVESILTANYGVLISDQEFIKVKDSVVFENFKEERLDTDLLHIDFKKDSVYTDKKVKVTSPKGTITGQGLVSNSNFTKYKVQNISDGLYQFEKEEVNLNEDSQNSENEN